MEKLPHQLVAPKELPVLLNEWEVRAALNGSLTQLWRPAKPQPEDIDNFLGLGRSEYKPGDWRMAVQCNQLQRYILCPYGQPKDRLWVQEAWAEKRSGVVYQADQDNKNRTVKSWSSAKTMPRTASRIVLVSGSIDIKRIQDIGNCKRTGITEWLKDNPAAGYKNYRDLLAQAWNTMHKQRSLKFESNPWCWVVNLKRA